MYVPEMPGAVTKNNISLSPIVPSQSQKAYSKGDNQISQETQTSGTSLTESGKPTSWLGYYAKCTYVYMK